jgi:small subunit ribosomal protein S2
VRLYCDSVAQAATTGRTEGVVDSGADIGAMEAPPEETVAVEEAPVAEEPAAEEPAVEAPAADEATAEA